MSQLVFCFSANSGIVFNLLYRIYVFQAIPVMRYFHTPTSYLPAKSCPRQQATQSDRQPPIPSLLSSMTTPFPSSHRPAVPPLPKPLQPLPSGRDPIFGRISGTDALASTLPVGIGQATTDIISTIQPRTLGEGVLGAATVGDNGVLGTGGSGGGARSWFRYCECYVRRGGREGWGCQGKEETVPLVL